MIQTTLERVDWSILSTLDECPRRCQYQYIYNMVPREPSLAPEFGKAIHAGWTGYYKGKRDLAAGLVAFEKAWTPFDGTDQWNEYTMAKGKELVEAYTTLFGTEPWEPIEANGSLGLELPFAIEVPGVSLLFMGIMDALGRETEGDKRMAFQEWKTTKSPWLFCSRPNGQLVGYAKAARELFGEEVRRCYLTIAGIFKSSEKGWMKGKKKGDPPKCVFTRELVDLDPWDFEEWEKDFRRKAFEIQTYTDDNYWPKRTKACSNYGGCPYKPLCIAPPSQREMFMETNFREHKWEPLEERR